MFIILLDYFTDFTKYEEPEIALGGKISNSFGFDAVKTAVAQLKADSDSTVGKYAVVVTMRIERYFSSLVEQRSMISNDVSDMLVDKNYFSIFTTCGANYIRSLRRGQEVTAIFHYESDNKAKAKAFADSLRLFVYGNDMKEVWEAANSEVVDGTTVEENAEAVNYDFGDILERLSIEITAFGLGATDNGMGAIVATSLDEFKEAMKSAFRSITQKKEDDEGEKGLLYLMEVVPWANNAEFLILSEINEDNSELYLPVPTNLIENQPCVTNNVVEDDFGKCCKEDERVDAEGGEGKTCEPKRLLPAIIMRDNIEMNAEFVSWLGSALQQKSNILTSLGQCVISLRSFPEQYDYYLLDSGSIEMDLTVKELKLALDPLDDLNLFMMLSKEREEYLDMFYDPCLSALYGKNLGDTRETDPIFFAALPWYKHEECMQVSCLQSNVAWDRKNGNGCVHGLLQQTTDSPIPLRNDTYCSQVTDMDTDESICSYTPDMEVIVRMDRCRQALPSVRDGRGEPTTTSIEYLLENFCSPEIDFVGGRVDASRMYDIDITAAICRGEEPPLFPSSSPSLSQLPSSLSDASMKPSSNPSLSPMSSPKPSPDGTSVATCGNLDCSRDTTGEGYQVCNGNYEYCVCTNGKPLDMPVPPGTKCCQHTNGIPGRVIWVRDGAECPLIDV